MQCTLKHKIRSATDTTTSTGLAHSNLCKPKLLAVTSKYHFSVELKSGKKIQCLNLGINREKADNIIIQEV